MNDKIPLEIEVKFYVNRFSSLRDRVIKLGGKSGGCVFERNIRFEDNNNSLEKNKSLLRLRQDNKSILTFKSQSRNLDNQFKILKELEVEVGNFENTQLLLESLGYHQEQIYEKWREKIVLKDTLICLDIMPFGNFLEIEGSKSGIKDCSKSLGLNWEKRIILNYLEMFKILSEQENFPFNDITFENFKGFTFDIANYIGRFR